MKIYTAIKVDNPDIQFYGSMRKLAKDLKVSATAISKAFNNDRPCKGFDILFVTDVKPKKRLTQKEKLHKTIEVLKRAKLIIDDNNQKLSDNGEYSNINIVRDIDRCIGYFIRPIAKKSNGHMISFQE